MPDVGGFFGFFPNTAINFFILGLRVNRYMQYNIFAPARSSGRCPLLLTAAFYAFYAFYTSAPAQQQYRLKGYPSARCKPCLAVVVRSAAPPLSHEHTSAASASRVRQASSKASAT